MHTTLENILVYVFLRCDGLSVWLWCQLLLITNSYDSGNSDESDESEDSEDSYESDNSGDSDDFDDSHDSDIFDDSDDFSLIEIRNYSMLRFVIALKTCFL